MTHGPNGVARPRVAARTLLALALAAAVLLGSSVRSEAAGAPALPASLTATAAPLYELQGFRWNRSVVSVYSNWEGGDCVFAGRDFTSPVPAIPVEVLNATLLTSIAEINRQARGGITLEYAGTATRRELCSTTPTRPIVVGFGSIPSTGQAMSFATPDFQSSFARYESARVFMSVGESFHCDDAPQYRDLQHTMTHELLHAVGLGHSTDESALMHAAYVKCRAGYIMQADDIAGLHALYPPTLPPPGVSTPTVTPTATGAFAQPVRFSSSGVSLTVFPGGAVQQLEAAADAVGASGVWVQDSGGQFRLLVVDGPVFLRQQFQASFPGGLAPNHAVTLVR